MRAERERARAGVDRARQLRVARAVEREVLEVDREASARLRHELRERGREAAAERAHEVRVLDHRDGRARGSAARAGWRGRSAPRVARVVLAQRASGEVGLELGRVVDRRLQLLGLLAPVGGILGRPRAARGSRPPPSRRRRVSAAAGAGGVGGAGAGAPRSRDCRSAARWTSVRFAANTNARIASAPVAQPASASRPSGAGATHRPRTTTRRAGQSAASARPPSTYVSRHSLQNARIESAWTASSTRSTSSAETSARPRRAKAARRARPGRRGRAAAAARSTGRTRGPRRPRGSRRRATSGCARPRRSRSPRPRRRPGSRRPRHAARRGAGASSSPATAAAAAHRTRAATIRLPALVSTHTSPSVNRANLADDAGQRNARP